jgi:hypothetical protein
MSETAKNSVRAEYGDSAVVRQKLAAQQQADPTDERRVAEQFARAVDQAVDGRPTVIVRRGEEVAAIVPLALLRERHLVQADAEGTEGREFDVLRFGE